ncbi:tetratricopeptide repeat protein [uncultured Bilophila sp.]|uniref:tetratricopeptide repeat protein n=1 Tax=uncultured Bilophila sp. TaxID=529385 RepID=UPI0025F59D55|nr:tetratricopeptide repeat protein [uncultured Bilophila sp.]
MKEYENNYQAKAAQEPDNPYWQYMAGEAFLQAGDYLPAMPFFEKALELAPYHPESKRGCAICLVMSGRHEQGLALCAELLASVPIDFTALLLSAEALIGLERHQEAAKAYSQAAAIDYEAVPLMLRKLALLTEQEPEKARRFATEMDKVFPGLRPGLEQYDPIRATTLD